MNVKQDQLVVAVSQMTSVDVLESNLKQIQNDIEKVGQQQNVDLVCFPENCLYMRIQEGEAVQFLNLQEGFWAQFSNLAQKYKLGIHLGSVPTMLQGQPYNSSIYIDHDGQIITNYQKMHLFDIQLENQKPIRESDVFRSGLRPHVIDVKGWKLGQSICYDLRFSDLFRYYAELEVDVLLIPSAFLQKTGEAHWHVLQRARAIESQCYVVASAQNGLHQSLRLAQTQRTTYGHSLVVGPWGDLVLDMQTENGIKVVTLQKAEIERVRRQIPMKNHRRRDFFKP